MKDAFEAWLIGHGYKKYTPSGSPSTVYAYLNGIDFVCTQERCDWKGLAQRIKNILPKYDIGGVKQQLGDRSHRTVINALKRFCEFVEIYRGQNDKDKGNGSPENCLHCVM